jgi:hypothetical protein
MSGKRRVERAATSLASRKEDRPLYFSGQLGITTNGEAQVEVPSRSGFVWVRLRNQLNEVIQAFNEEVSTVYDLPVLVEWDKFSPNRYRIVGRDRGRYLDWGSSSSYLPIHGAQHQFNTLTGAGGGDIVWVYSQQFQPLLVTPSGTAGAFSVSIQPHVYYWNSEFQYAGGTGIAGFDGLWPTGSSNARMLLVYLDPDTGNVNLATGSLTEFSNTLTGTADVIPYVPSLIAPEDIPLSAVRLITGTSTIQWTNLYDIRTYFASAGGAYGGSGAPANAQYVTMALNGTLSDERVLTAGADIDIADGGAGGNVTVGVSTGTFSRANHSHAAQTMQHFLTVEGTLIVDSNPLRLYNNYGGNKTISEVFLSVDTPPTDASIIVDVNKDGTTIFTSQANRPVIVAGANTGNTTTIDVPTWADGEYLTIDVDQIGSGTAGSDLTVHIIYS